MRLLDSFDENPTGVVVSVLSFLAIVGGLVLGISRGSFNSSPGQNKLEAQKTEENLRLEEIAIANKMFDAGCEGVFYLKPKTNVFQPLSKGSGVLSGAYWQRFHEAKGPKPSPSLTDYLPEGTVVCDAYGNIGALKPSDKGYGVLESLLNTPDRARIKKMMDRYPTATRPQVGAK